MNDSEKSTDLQQKMDGMTAAINDLRQLAHSVIAQREEDIRRYSKEVHNSPSQLLTQLSLILYQLKSAEKPAAAVIDESLALVKKISSEIRRIYQDSGIVMVDHLGLTDTLEWYINRFQNSRGTRVDYICATGEEPAPLPVSRAVLRIVDVFLTQTDTSLVPVVHVFSDAETITLHLAFQGEQPLSSLLPQPVLCFIEERARMANGHTEFDPKLSDSLRIIFPLTV